MKADAPAARLQAPAQVDVVAGRAVAVVEAVYCRKRVAPEGHVAARHVLGQGVGEQHLHRSTRCVGHAIGNRPIAVRRDVGASHADPVARHEAVGQEVQPVRVGVGVVVDVGDDFAMRLLPAQVARGRQAPVGRARQAHEVVFSRDGRGGVFRAVVDDDDVQPRVGQALDPFQRVADGARAVAAADHDADQRPGGVGGEGQLLEGRSHRRQRGFGAAVAPHQAEVPVLDVVAAAVPLVGPGEDESPGAAGSEGRAHLPVQAVRLFLVAVAAAVQADLGHQQRLLAGQVLQPVEVGLQRLAAFQIDVEADDVDERQLQVLGRREVDVGDQRTRVLGLDRAHQPRQEGLDLLPAVPAHDGRRDLVAHGVTQHGGVPGAGAHTGAHALLDVVGAATVVEECDVLFPRQAHHHAQTVARGGVEQPGRRHGIAAHRVDAVLLHGREVGFERGVFRVVVAQHRGIGTRTEGAVGHAAQVELGVACEEELAAHAHRHGHRRIDQCSSRERGNGCRRDACRQVCQAGIHAAAAATASACC